jgi:hypothetical protein
MKQPAFNFYSITLEDVTPDHPGFNRAKSVRFDGNDIETDKRPHLKDILDWIDSQALKIREAINGMRHNRGTQKILLHARFPLKGPGVHEVISFSIPVTEPAIEELKAKAAAVYESVPNQYPTFLQSG